MAPSTRNIPRIVTPSKRKSYFESDTPKKSAFFNAWDNRTPGKSLRSIATRFQVHHSTASNWLNDRELNGSPAFRRQRKRSKKLGRKSRISTDTCEMLVSPSRNPVRDQLLEAQIEYHHLDISRRQLTRRLDECTNRGQRYKMAFSKTEFSESNITQRYNYGVRWEGSTIEDTFQWWLFTDEAHFDPTAQKAGYILRERGNRLEPENIQMRGKKMGTKLHVAGWCNWWDMTPELTFYHDEEEHIEQPKRPRKPVKTMYESSDEYNERLKVWEAMVPHPAKVKPLGNSMTGKYYSERILPGLIIAIHNLRRRWELKGEEEHFILQEDNDRSHGHTRFDRPDTVQDRIKKEARIETIDHPAKSPDLNPQEAVWNILKGAIKKRTWHTLIEYKDVIREEYSKITLSQVRERILEMPWRIERVKAHPDIIIKSDHW